MADTRVNAPAPASCSCRCRSIKNRLVLLLKDPRGYLLSNRRCSSDAVRKSYPISALVLLSSTLGLEEAMKPIRGLILPIEVGFFLDDSIRKFTDKSPRPCVNTFRTSIRDGLAVFQRIRDGIVAVKLQVAWPGFIGFSVKELEDEKETEFTILSSTKEDVNANPELRYKWEFCSHPIIIP